MATWPAKEAPSGLLANAADAALGALDPEERYILAAYYLDQRILADIARTLKVHESTISRRVEKIAANTRKNVLGYLIKAGMGRRQAEEAIEIDVRDLSLDLRQALVARAPRQDLPGPSAKKAEISSAKSAQDSSDRTF